jgi:hypothetical protein
MYFSAASQNVIDTFAANMGITAQPAPDNSYGFEFAQSGLLSIIPSEDGSRVIICLALDQQHVDPLFHDRFSRLGGPHPRLGIMLHAAMGENGSFVLATGIEQTDFTHQLLDQTVSTLIDLVAITQKGQI